MVGKIPVEVLDSLLDSLPVELSFVDAEDMVKYYNKAEKRIFDRQSEVIGREVQDCHPEKSLKKVEEILNGFKNGSLNKAEFWINFKDKKILIGYYPVRDASGNYLGCVEVTQDITGIQKMTGQKKLLSDEN